MAKKGLRAKASGKTPTKNEIPEVYKDMLADAVSSPAQRSEDGRAVKRRRVGGRIVIQPNDDHPAYQSNRSDNDQNDNDLNELFVDVQPAKQQIVWSDSEDSADSDSNWEEVNLSERINPEGASETGEAGSGDLNLVFHNEDRERMASARAKAKRKPISAEERRLRLEIHKMHLCSLLAHVYLRNHWCNDDRVHSALRQLLTTKTVSYLNPDETLSQFQRSRSFMDGLEQASEIFRSHFKIKARGLARSRWAENPETLTLLQPPDDIDLPTQSSDFCENSRRLRGSRDIGAQLFCALLRSAGVEARLVCSLLPLPFQPAQKIELSQVRQHAAKLPNSGRRVSPDLEDEHATESDGSVLRRSLPPESPSSKLPVRSKARKPIRESKYPVYWVEAFNESVQKWVPVDPLVTKSIAKASKFEPPAGEPENHMSYVVAFEDDGSARDVTRRYVKAYNAKTRRNRIEVTNGGERWWRKVMRMYRRYLALDRDQVEDAELAGKEAAEPMPRNVQDFKDHPYYALERHLKRHEVIHPKREVGKVGTGRAGDTTTLEPIYRRRDVHMVKSGDKWYRMGREIKPGEQPLKRVPARRVRERSLNPEDLNAPSEDKAGTALYAAYQTALYVAPAVTNGRIPKNVYGNLDLYVPSMVPPGGVHIAHHETARAARILVVDYADAVTGFSFRGRHGTAITKGAVIATEYREAVEAVIQAFEDERTQAEETKRSAEAMRMWKRLLAGLRIRQRIDGYEIEGERDVAMQEEMKKPKDDEADEDDEGGGFLLDHNNDEYARPTVGRLQADNSLERTEDGPGGFLIEGKNSESNSPDRARFPNDCPRDRCIDSLDDDYGGGFLVNDDIAEGEDARREVQDGESVHLNNDVTGQDEQATLGSRLNPRNDLTNLDGQATLRVAQNDDQKRSSESITGHFGEGTVQGESSHEEATLNLSHDQLEESRLLEHLYEAGATTAPNTGNESSTPLDPGATYPSSDISAAVKPESSDSGRGSLLSHDPDDEDADPDWIS